ncbi:MAG: alkaline phosphatase family protein [Armatimonadota bacterium]
MPRAKRALLLGLDAMVTSTVERFLAEGVLPNFARLLERGCLTRIRPVIPAQTPTNWNTLATGATPGTHGVVQWGSHLPGEPVWEFHREEAFNVGLCRAEYLWEAAARAGRRSVVMNYAGYPPSTGEAVFIEWLFQPARSYFDLSPATVYHNLPEANTTDPIELAPAEGWSNLPACDRPPLESRLQVVTSTEGTGPGYHVLVAGDNGAYDTVLIASSKDAANPVASLKVGEWSDWVRAPFTTADQGEAEGAFRFKLLSLSPDGRSLSLYRSDAFPTDGRFCSDADLGRGLVGELGPYLHAGASCGLHCRGWLDWETTDQVLAAEAEWWSAAAHTAMEVHNASLLVLHWHILDAMGHRFVPLVDPTGTDYEAAKAEENWEIIRGYYRAADRFLGAFLDRFDDGDTVFAVVSDHGMPANKKAVSLVNVFKDRGWVTLSPDGKRVDWPQSKVFFVQNHLWISLEGRDEGGIVPKEDYDSLRAEILAAMRDLKDPETGEHVIAFALAREDAPMVGLWGDYIGDVVFCYSGGYRWSGPEVLQMGEERVVFPCGGGNHGPMLPTYETEATSVMGALVLGGAGVRPGVELPKLDQFGLCTTDVAPTLAHLLGLEPPAQSEGRVLREFLDECHSDRPARALVPTARSLVARPTVQARAIGLQGDVTDEE